MVSFGIVGETQNAYETEEKMEMAKQDTTKTSFLTLSCSKISIVVTGIVPKTEADYDVNDLTSFFYLLITASFLTFKISTP